MVYMEGQIKMNEYNPKRKYLFFKDGYYWVVNLDWIKKQIVKTYSGSLENNIKQELVIHKSVGCYFFVLRGTPPKGYAIYQPKYKFLIIIDAFGKIIQHNNIILKGVNNV